MPRHADESGFTLIEVLVATTIAALLLLPLLRGFSTGLVTTTRQRRTQRGDADRGVDARDGGRRNAAR